MLNLVPLRLRDAEIFLAKFERHYRVPVEPLGAVGVADETGLRGAAILGIRDDGDAELAHIYADGTSQAYTLLYGACWRILKAYGYKKAAL